MTRDISAKTFRRWCARYGFVPAGAYYTLPCGVKVATFNVDLCPNNRQKLAFLISENERMSKYLNDAKQK